MDKNIKIAKEILKLAKTLIADENKTAAGKGIDLPNYGEAHDEQISYDAAKKYLKQTNAKMTSMFQKEITKRTKGIDFAHTIDLAPYDRDLEEGNTFEAEFTMKIGQGE